MSDQSTKQLAKTTPAPDHERRSLYTDHSQDQGLPKFQQRYGNQAMTGLMPATTQAGSAPTLQAKMVLGAVQDPLEHEADKMARHVVERTASPNAGAAVQRQAEDEEVQAKSMEPAVQRQMEDEDVQTKSMDASVQREGEDEAVQAKANGGSAGGGILDEGIGSAIRQAQGGGAPLDGGIRQKMEQGFGADFTGVRIHTDSHAHGLNENLHAKAFTTGSDIFFRQGQYAPGSKSGQELVAHELTHVIQQRAGKGPAQSPGSSQGAQRQSEQVQRIPDEEIRKGGSSSSINSEGKNTLHERGITGRVFKRQGNEGEWQRANRDKGIRRGLRVARKGVANAAIKTSRVTGLPIRLAAGAPSYAAGRIAGKVANLPQLNYGRSPISTPGRVLNMHLPHPIESFKAGANKSRLNKLTKRFKNEEQ